MLVCLAYFKSLAIHYIFCCCIEEGQYVFRHNKKVLPLKMQHMYYPDGWLGALIGNQLYFDFSAEDKFDDSIDNVIKELRIVGTEGLRFFFFLT